MREERRPQQVRTRAAIVVCCFGCLWIFFLVSPDFVCVVVCGDGWLVVEVEVKLCWPDQTVLVV